jgi:heme A synthase
VGIHFAHRVVAVVIGLAVLALGFAVLKSDTSSRVQCLAGGVVLAVAAQISLGFISVWARLSVTPVSLHTLVAAALLVHLVMMTTYGWEPAVRATRGTVGAADPTTGNAAEPGIGGDEGPARGA